MKKTKPENILLISVSLILSALLIFLVLNLSGLIGSEQDTESKHISDNHISNDPSDGSVSSNATGTSSSGNSVISSVTFSGSASNSISAEYSNSVMSDIVSEIKSGISEVTSGHSDTEPEISHYQRKNMDYSRVELVKDIMSDHHILSYAYGGLETSETSAEYRQVVDKATASGYTCIMVSVGPNYKYNHTFDTNHISSIRSNFDYAVSKGLKLFVRIYPSVSEHNINDLWDTGSKVYYYPDYFDNSQFDILLEYNREFMKIFSSNPDIIAFSPTFGFLGQSLYDADNFSSNPFSRVTGYSAIANTHFNSLYGYQGSLPKPHMQYQLQDMKTILWFKTRHLQLTKYAEAVVAECRKLTQKPVGVFAELYSGAFAHQSEAAPQNLDFWLQDCTFGSTTYDMQRTFCETHGNSENYSTYEEYYDSVKFYLEEAQMNGAKLIGFYFRRKNESTFNSDSYSFRIINDIRRLEGLYPFKNVDEPQIAVYFGGNYGYTAFPNAKNFLLRVEYRVSADRIRSVLMDRKLTFRMFGDSDIETLDFSKYKLVFIPNFVHFTDKDWQNINKASDTVFVFSGDFAAGYYSPSTGFSSTTKWGQSKEFNGIAWNYKSGISLASSVNVVNDIYDIFEDIRNSQLTLPKSTTLASASFKDAPDANITATIGQEVFMFTRKSGRHMYFGTNTVFNSDYSDKLIGNIIEYSLKIN